MVSVGLRLVCRSEGRGVECALDRTRGEKLLELDPEVGWPCMVDSYLVMRNSLAGGSGFQEMKR